MTLVLSPEFAGYDRILAIDSEYTPRLGQLPHGICYAMRELRSDDPIVTRWVHDGDVGECPYDPNDDRTLIVSYSAAAELSFFRACGWRLPKNVYDLWIAFRIYSNGRHWHSGLLDALRVFNIPHHTNALEKERLQQRCIRGGPFSLEDRQEIPAYCATDIDPLGQLLTELSREVDTAQVIELGKYVIHAALVEERGLPIDVPRLELMSRRWDEILRASVVRANARMNFRIYGGPGRHHLSRSYAQVEKLFRYTGLDKRWPRTDTGQLALDKQTLKDSEGRHPCLVHLRQAEKMLNMAHPKRIALGPDGRCRTAIRAYAARTSRSQSRAVTPLAFAGGMRAIIVPRSGTAIIVADYDQADPGTAAALSNDQAMLDDYLNEPDFYMAFAARVGAVTKGTLRSAKNEALRSTYKTVTCAVMYGSGALNLSMMLGCDLDAARANIRRFFTSYRDYRIWTEIQKMQARIDGFLSTPSGWVEHSVRGPAAQNFGVQAVVADILRRASLMLDAAGIPVIFPLHDALTVEVPEAMKKEAAKEVARIMGDAAEEIIGIRLRVSVDVFGPGKRYFKDPKAKAWWADISSMLGVDP